MPEYLRLAIWIVPLVVVGWLLMTLIVGYAAYRILRSQGDDGDDGDDLKGIANPDSHSLPVEPVESPEMMWEEDYGGEG